MSEPLNIDVAGAAAALEAAGGPDALPTPAPTDPWTRDPAGRFAPNTPSAAPTPAAAADPPAAAPTTPEAGTETVPDFTDIPDSALTPELVQMRRSMQADYTRKMQEAAPWRKLGQELGVENPEDFRAAAEVYQRLQDPRNWPTITAELTEYMQSYGMAPKEAAAAAANQLADIAPDQELDPSDFEDGGPDPATLRVLQQLAQEVQSLKGTITQRDQQAQQQAEWHATATRLTQAEAQIRAAHPHYNDQVIEAIYALTGQDGDLNAAQLRYESLIGAQVAQYIGSKESAVTTAPTPVPGGGVLSSEPPAKLTAEQAHAAAMAHVARLDALDAQT